MKEIKPLNDKILVRILPEESITAGGLVIPDTAKAGNNKGEVVEVGTGIELADGSLRPIPLNIGDKVLFTEGRGIEVKMEDGESYLIVGIRDVIATFVE